MAKKSKKNTEPKPNNTNASASYTAKDIYVLEGLEPVRKRPGMYIGSTGIDGLHHLVWEVVDNSIDEAMAGFAKNIALTLLPHNRVMVVDDGRGIPVEKHKQTKKSALETVMTTLHAGGKFGGESYKVAAGLHGVGVSVVCALSKWMRAEVCRDEVQYAQEYSAGKTTTPVKKIGKCDGSGTAVTFEPDPEIFKEIIFEWDRILERLRQQAYLTRGVTLMLRDERNPEKAKDGTPLIPSYAFSFEGGIVSYVKHLNRNETPKHENIFFVSKEADINGGRKIIVETAFQYTDDIQSKEMSFANHVHTPEGGTHLTGFRTALTRSLNDYAKKNEYFKKDDDALTGEDVREGLTAVVSVKLQEAQFEGQTKAKLGNPEARAAVESTAAEAIQDFFEKNPSDAQAIIAKALLAQKARKAAKAAKETVLRKGALEGFTLPGKLADCQSKKPEESELFLVEGDSAGGCFSGDTKIALPHGRNITFKELVAEHERGKNHYCYTIKKDGGIGVEKIENPRITKRNADVLKVAIDNGEEITCTPDHLFLLRDRSYKPAIELSRGDSLMPLYRKLYEKGGRITNEVRRKTGDPTLLKLDTIPGRFLEGKYKRLEAAVTNFNHKIESVAPLPKRVDVYDLEVPNTHNFALASGVFVHNSAKSARDRKFQAILPLRGKILNVEKARLDKALSFAEIKALIIALGAAIGDEFDEKRLRYHRIIIATDADVDGAHIRTLLLTLFFRYFPLVIERGYLYIATPPLYRLQSGKEIRYAYSDAEKDKVTSELQKARTKTGLTKIFSRKKQERPTQEPKTGETETAAESGESVKGVDIQRYKGLGEMNPEQLWETTMDPGRRILKQVAVDDATEADRIFDILMGDEVLPRKQFIQTHAKAVKNLDI